jgi:hypothetical protein
MPNDMETNQLLSDSSLDSPTSNPIIPANAFKLPKQRQWQDLAWLLITLAIYFNFTTSQPTANAEIPKLNGNYYPNL